MNHDEILDLFNSGKISKDEMRRLFAGESIPGVTPKSKQKDIRPAAKADPADPFDIPQPWKDAKNEGGVADSTYPGNISYKSEMIPVEPDNETVSRDIASGAIHSLIALALNKQKLFEQIESELGVGAATPENYAKTFGILMRRITAINPLIARGIRDVLQGLEDIGA